MFLLEPRILKSYLESLHAAPIKVLRVDPLREDNAAGSVKGYGYGVPVRVSYRVGGEDTSAVFETVNPSAFGHQTMADRAQILLWSHRAFQTLPRHVRSLDVGAMTADGSLVSLGKVEELFLVVEYADGAEYAQDLRRLVEEGELQDVDLARADALADYLAEIHRLRHSREDLYLRRIRELVGHGECIMGLIDSYPRRRGFITPQLLERIEHLVVKWRWRVKTHTDRLRQVHGDFHPWNILFRKGTEFSVLDRSRGEWGEPADDVTCLSLNYLFFSLLRTGTLEGPFETLFTHFWDRYLEMTQDGQILEVAAPFFAFRALVLASPIWYPDLDEDIRRKLFNFIVNVLESRTFDPKKVHDYCRN